MCIFSSVLEGSVIWVICPTQSLVPILPHSTLSHSSWHPHLAHHLWAPGLGLWSKWPGWTLVLPLTFLCSSWDSHGKYTGVVCHSLLQWITFCQNSPVWPLHLGCPCLAWLIASLSYISPFTMTWQWSMKGWIQICTKKYVHKCSEQLSWSVQEDLETVPTSTDKIVMSVSSSHENICGWVLSDEWEQSEIKWC